MEIQQRGVSANPLINNAAQAATKSGNILFGQNNPRDVAHTRRIANRGFKKMTALIAS